MEALPNKINVRINEGASCVETRNVCNPEEEILLKSRKRKLIARKKHCRNYNTNFFQPLQQITLNCYSLYAEILQIHPADFLISSKLNITDIGWIHTK